MAVKAKRRYDYRGFTGPDADIETSLREYGIAWKCTNKRRDEYKFVYAINWSDGEADLYDYGFMTRKQWATMCNEEWFRVRELAETLGIDSGNVIAGFPALVQDALTYHGYENIFGACYLGGFEIVSRRNV